MKRSEENTHKKRSFIKHGDVVTQLKQQNLAVIMYCFISSLHSLLLLYYVPAAFY